MADVYPLDVQEIIDAAASLREEQGAITRGGVSFSQDDAETLANMLLAGPNPEEADRG